jgi:hypothetical protein
MNEVTSGIITGNWQFVWAAYVTYWVILGGYAASLINRQRKELT